MNKVILKGNICEDIVIRKAVVNDQGVSVVQNTIAVKNDRPINGEYKSQFFNFEIWRQGAEYLAKYATKGSSILIEGTLNNNNYTDKNGNKVYKNYIKVEKVELLKNPTQKSESQDVNNAETNVETKTTSSIKVEELDYTDDDIFQQFGNEIADSDLPF